MDDEIHKNEIVEQIERVRACLKGQSFDMQMVVMIFLMVEAVSVKHGRMASDVFQDELREAYRKVVGRSAN